MSSINKALIAQAQACSRAKRKPKFNFSPSIESYVIRMGWCSKHFDGYRITYQLRPGFQPNQARVRQAVDDLSK